MLLPLAAGVVATVFLLFVSALFSPEWRHRKTIWDHGGSGPGPDGARPGVFLAFGLFGIAVGIPASLGFLAGNALLILAGFVATMTTRVLLGASRMARPEHHEKTPGEVPDGIKTRPAAEPSAAWRPWHSSWGWFVSISWAYLAASLSTGSFDLRRALANQVVLGPPALRGSWFSVLMCAAFLAALFSAAFWMRVSPPLSGILRRSRADASLRWGEAALAGAALSGGFFGPSVGALIWGPGTSSLRSAVAASYLLTCGVVAGLSWSRRMKVFRGWRAGMIASAAVSLGTMILAGIRT